MLHDSKAKFQTAPSPSIYAAHGLAISLARAWARLPQFVKGFYEPTPAERAAKKIADELFPWPRPTPAEDRLLELLTKLPREFENAFRARRNTARAAT